MAGTGTDTGGTHAGGPGTAGYSPMVTPGPSLAELRKRQEKFNPPREWCGLIGGSWGNVLQCPQSTPCIFFGSAVGCCTEGKENFATCSDLYTSCVDEASLCDADCRADTRILRCAGAQQHSYCATYSFSADYAKYTCVSDTTSYYTNVVKLRDFFASVSGGELGGEVEGFNIPATGASFTTRADSDSSSTSISSTSRTNGASRTAQTQVAEPKKDGISIGTIAGIAGGIVVLIIVVAIVGCCIFRRRKRRQHLNKIPRPQQHHPPPPVPVMQQGPAPQSQGYGAATELHNTSSQIIPMTPYGNNSSYSYTAPPQYTPQGVDPKHANATEMDGAPYKHSYFALGAGAGQTPDPNQRADTVSPMSGRPNHGGYVNSPWGQPQQGPVFEMGPGRR